jgi:transglutaminase-like putative cysteine protease
MENIVIRTAGLIVQSYTSPDTAANIIRKFVDYIMKYGQNQNSIKDTQYLFNHIPPNQKVITDKDIFDAIYNAPTDSSIVDNIITGQCMDYAGMSCALLRAVGIPARTVLGTYNGAGIFHMWVEYWGRNDGSGNLRWIVLDDSELNDGVIGISERSTYKYGYPDSEGIFMASSKWVVNSEQVHSSDDNNINNEYVDDVEPDGDLMEIHAVY